MPHSLSRRAATILSAYVLSSLTWAGHAAAQDAPALAAPLAPAPAAPAQETKPQDPDKGQVEDKSNLLAQNSVFAEGLGAAILYSFNYERMVIDQLGVRVGFSYFSVGASANAGTASSSASASYVLVPVTASYVGLRSGRSALELGGGLTLLYVSASSSAAGVATSAAGIVPFGVAMIGYRNQPVGHAGFMFRIGLEALVANGLGLQDPNPNNLGALPLPYMSMGASF